MRDLQASPRIVVLAGGVGGARMALGFASAVPQGSLTVVVNVGDDENFHGLRVCPDLDTVLYTLSGLVNKQQAWGVAGDTTRALDVLKRLGAEDSWMSLGDADIGLHLYRTARLRAGARLTEVTREICGAFGVPTRVLPVSDAEVRTTVLSSTGRLFRFQEWFVANRAEPPVEDLYFEGAGQAPATAEVVRALHEADLIVFAPSNPFLSILPILKVRGLSESLRASRAVKVAVSPLINGAAVKGPLTRLMSDLKVRSGNQGIIDFYHGLAQGLAIDSSDANDRGDVVANGMRALVTSTRIPDQLSATDLARSILAWSSSIEVVPGGADA